MKNVAPVIQEVEITPENYKFPAPVAVRQLPSSSPATLIAASDWAAIVGFQ